MFQPHCLRRETDQQRFQDGIEAKAVNHRKVKKRRCFGLPFIAQRQNSKYEDVGQYQGYRENSPGETPSDGSEKQAKVMMVTGQATLLPASSVSQMIPIWGGHTVWQVHHRMDQESQPTKNKAVHHPNQRERGTHNRFHSATPQAHQARSDLLTFNSSLRQVHDAPPHSLHYCCTVASFQARRKV